MRLRRLVSCLQAIVGYLDSGCGDLGILGFRFAAIDPVLAVSGVLLVAVVNILAVVACRVIPRLIDTELLHQDLEPLTGPLNRAAFYEEFATLVAARSRKEDRYLVVAVIGLDGLSVCTRAGDASDANWSRIAIAQQLRGTARSTAIIGHFSDSEFVFADVFTTAEPAPLQSASATQSQRHAFAGRQASGWSARHCLRWLSNHHTKYSTRS